MRKSAIDIYFNTIRKLLKIRLGRNVTLCGFDWNKKLHRPMGYLMKKMMPLLKRASDNVSDGTCKLQY